MAAWGRHGRAGRVMSRPPRVWALPRPGFSPELNPRRSSQLTWDTGTGSTTVTAALRGGQGSLPWCACGGEAQTEQGLARSHTARNTDTGNAAAGMDPLL